VRKADTHLRQSLPSAPRQGALSYSQAFCFIALMKPALALFAIFIASSPFLKPEKYVDSVSTS
jgi:hypothetical protein